MGAIRHQMNPKAARFLRALKTSTIISDVKLKRVSASPQANDDVTWLCMFEAVVHRLLRNAIEIHRDISVPHVDSLRAVAAAGNSLIRARGQLA
jgi:hypothetical protein